GNIVQQRAGSSCHVHRIFSGEAVAHKVFRQLQRAELLEELWLMLSHPQQFRYSEVRKCRIACPCNQTLFSDLVCEFARFFCRALIAPDKSRTQGDPMLLEQDSPMHLS